MGPIVSYPDAFLTSVKQEPKKTVFLVKDLYCETLWNPNIIQIRIVRAQERLRDILNLIYFGIFFENKHRRGH